MAPCRATAIVVVAFISAALPAFATTGRTPTQDLALQPPSAVGQTPSSTGGLVLDSAERERQAQPGTKKDADKKRVGEEDKQEDKGFKFVFKDRPSLRYGSAFRLDLRLLVQADVRQSAQDLEPVGGSYSLERRRIGIQGTFLKMFEYEVEKELDSQGEWRDVFLNVRPASFAQAQAGKFKVPFGREELTSPRARDFAYKSRVIDEVAPRRAMGGMLHGRLFGQRVHYQAGVFDGDGENSPNVEPPPYPIAEDAAGSQRSIAARVRAAPFSERRGSSLLKTLEFGAAVVPSTVPAGMNHFRVTTVFGYHLFPRTVYVNGNRLRLGAEFSWTPGPFSIEGEYVRAREERRGMGVGSESGLDNDLPPLVTQGWYTAATWVVTGEKKDGGIKPRQPLLQGGLGAVELAARYDVIRVGAGDTSVPPTTNPRAADIAAASDAVATIGVNWYVNTW
jgi:phosphate-selective porin OprO/OprP